MDEQIENNTTVCVCTIQFPLSETSSPRRGLEKVISQCVEFFYVVARFLLPRFLHKWTFDNSRYTIGSMFIAPTDFWDVDGGESKAMYSK